MCVNSLLISSTRVKSFPHYGSINVTLSLLDHLVKEIRKIAVERDTTLTGMVREYLERVAARIWSDDLNAGQNYFGAAVANPFVD